MSKLTTVRWPSGRVVHGRQHTVLGQKTLCGRRGDPRGGYFDLTPLAEDRITCAHCLRALDEDKSTRRDVVPGQVVRVRWWNGRRWYTTYEAVPCPS